MEDLAHMGSRCHICLLDYRFSGSIHTPLRSSSHGSELCCWCEGRRWWKTWPTWEAAATSVCWRTPPQAAYTLLSVALVMDPNSVLCEGRRWWKTWPTWGAAVTSVCWSTVNVRISAAFGLFYVLQRNFEMRHYFNDVKVPKNSQDQCEFEL